MNTYKRHRFPPNIISYAVWLYNKFNLSHRDIEDLLAEHGIIVSRESIRLVQKVRRYLHPNPLPGDEPGRAARPGVCSQNLT